MSNKTDKNENFNRELEPKNQVKILELKNIINEIKKKNIEKKGSNAYDNLYQFS